MNKLITICLLILTTGVCNAQPGKNNKQTTGKPISIGISVEINSAILGEKRTLNIYFPEGYKENDTTKYPVIYLLDGGMDEDFLHVVGLVQFDAMPWVNTVQPSIVVGIANTDRKRDMTYPTTIKTDKEKFPTTGGSDKFIAFVEKELQPYIREKYKTNNEKTIIGQSLAGLLATEILFKKPYLFTRYIIISPSLWWDNGSLLKQPMALTAANPDHNIAVYLGVGKEGLAQTVEPHVMEVDANLMAEKIENLKNKNINLYFDYLPEENHATIGHLAVFNAFRKLQNKPGNK